MRKAQRHDGGANSQESLRDTYNDLQEFLKQYFDVCMKIAEYNALLSEFAPATVEYEPMDA